ncbi:MAG: hypothetical protein ACI8UP_002963 [Porticoccaceae bacterium]
MENGERKKRDTPERSHPNRGFANLFGQPVGHNANDHQSESSPDNAWTGNVDRGVKLGYKVIEEQILQGQRFAEQISAGSYGAGSMNGDMQDLAKNIQRYSEDTIELSSKILESLTSEMPGMGTKDFLTSNTLNQGVQSLVESFTRAFATGNAASGTNGREDHQSTSRSTGGTDVNIVCSVSSKRPVDINVNVQSVRGTLCIDRLYEHDIDKSPLTEVTLERESATQLRLKIHVADNHPAGHYSGVVYDPVSKNHCGTLSVTISD